MSDERNGNASSQRICLPKPDADNITVLTDSLPNDPVLPWHHFDSPWLEDEAGQKETEFSSEQQDVSAQDAGDEIATQAESDENLKAEPEPLSQASATQAVLGQDAAADQALAVINRELPVEPEESIAEEEACPVPVPGQLALELSSDLAPQAVSQSVSQSSSQPVEREASEAKPWVDESSSVTSGESPVSKAPATEHSAEDEQDACESLGHA